MQRPFGRDSGITVLTTLFFVKFLFQAVYLEFCISRVLAGNRWPSATENGGSLRKRHGQGWRKPVGLCSSGGRGRMPWPLLGLKGKESWSLEPREAAAQRGSPGRSCRLQQSEAANLPCRDQTPTEPRPLVCPGEFVHLHSSGHHKRPLPITQEKTLHMNIIRWPTWKSD